MTKIVANTAILSLTIFVPFTGVLVSFAAVFWGVTQRSPGGYNSPVERCVTSRKTAAKETVGLFDSQTRCM